jgi:uncharacterized protein (DUF305 family)
VTIGAALALLLVGAAIGLMIGMSTQDPSALPGPESVDVGFAQDMSYHHDQAVQMSVIVGRTSADPAVRQLAFDIESNQLTQMGRMRAYLDVWGRQEVTSGKNRMAWMRDSGHAHGNRSSAPNSPDRPMPGMATAEEMARLRTLTGPEQDTFYLQLMLRHHDAGSPMAQYGKEHAGTSQIRNLADAILRTQNPETVEMRRMLSARGGEPLPED